MASQYYNPGKVGKNFDGYDYQALEQAIKTAITQGKDPKSMPELKDYFYHVVYGVDANPGKRTAIDKAWQELQSNETSLKGFLNNRLKIGNDPRNQNVLVKNFKPTNDSRYDAASNGNVRSSTKVWQITDALHDDYMKGYDVTQTDLFKNAPADIQREVLGKLDYYYQVPTKWDERTKFESYQAYKGGDYRPLSQRFSTPQEMDAYLQKSGSLVPTSFTDKAKAQDTTMTKQRWDTLDIDLKERYIEDHGQPQFDAQGKLKGVFDDYQAPGADITKGGHFENNVWVPDAPGNTTSGTAGSGGASGNSFTDKYNSVSPEARTLFETAFTNGLPANLQDQTWWQPVPENIRKEAWSLIQSLSTPEGLADFVLAKGITDLQSKSWWSSNPNKEQAWAIIDQKNKTTGQAGGAAGGGTGSGGAGTPGGSGTGTTTPPGGTANPGGSTGGTGSGSGSGSGSSAEPTPEELDQFWTEWTQLQTALTANPELMNSLINEVSYFDPYFSNVYERLKQDKDNQILKLQTSYQQKLDQIGLEKDLDQKQKSEVIKKVTDDFISAHEDLNLSSDLAYRNASKALQQSAVDAGNTAAQAYLVALTGNVANGGNIATLNADKIVNALKSSRQDIAEQSNIQQLDIALQRRKAFKQLEQEVGTEKANQILSQAEASLPSLTNENIGQQVADKAGLRGISLAGVKEVSNLLNLMPKQGASNSNYTGNLNQQTDANDARNALQVQQLGQNTNMSVNDTVREYTRALQDAQRQEKETKLSYVTNNLQYTPYAKQGDKFVLGSQAKALGGKSFAERYAKFTNSLPSGTFQIS